MKNWADEDWGLPCSTDLEDGDGVALMRLASGQAMFLPASVVRKGPEAVAAAQRVRSTAQQLYELGEKLAGEVAEARVEGLSWESIAFLTGVTAKTAKLRWDEADE